MSAYKEQSRILTELATSLISEDAKQLVKSRLDSVIARFRECRGERKIGLSANFIIGKILQEYGRDEEARLHFGLLSVGIHNTGMHYWNLMYPQERTLPDTEWYEQPAIDSEWHGLDMSLLQPKYENVTNQILADFSPNVNS
jgi:hypothetical protein